MYEMYACSELVIAALVISFKTSETVHIFINTDIPPQFSAEEQKRRIS